VPDVACWQAGTGATVTLLIVFFWILVVLARPFRPWKAALIASMVGVSALAFLTPLGRTFFQFDLPAPLFWQSLLVGVVGAIAVEVIYLANKEMRAVQHISDPPEA
jgi:cation-transporting ATPase E